MKLCSKKDWQEHIWKKKKKLSETLCIIDSIMLCCPLDWVSIIQASKARRVQDSVQHPADLVSEGVHMLRGTCHRGMPRGCRPCNGADVARDCRDCPLERGIVGPFEVGSRKKGGAFKTNPSGYYPYSCAYINQFEWDKKQSKPHKEKHDSCALWGKGHFLPPIKYAPATLLLIPPPSF